MDRSLLPPEPSGGEASACSVAAEVIRIAWPIALNWLMMTSGGAAKYKGSLDCFQQVLRNEGFMSLMKGAGANILRGVAGAGVLAGFDKFQQMYIAFRTGQ